MYPIPGVQLVKRSAIIFTFEQLEETKWRAKSFLISFLFSVHWQTQNDFFWFLCDVYEMARQMFLKFPSFFRYIDRLEIIFFLVCAWCVLKQLFTSILVTVMVIYLAAPWLSKKYLSTSISANNCLLSRWLLDLVVCEDKPFYSWARNSHSERKKILLFPSTYTKLNFFSSDIPVIPDLEDVQEEDMMTQIAAPPRWDVTLPTGGGGGWGRQIFLRSQTWSMYKKRTWWHILRPHPSGMLLYPWGGGGFAGISKEWPYTSILCFD